MLYIERLTACDELRETLQRYLNYNGATLASLSSSTSSSSSTTSSFSYETIPAAEDQAPEVAVERRPENLNKVKERADGYQISIRNFPRPYKNLVVLDIDYTILDLGLYEKGVADGVNSDQLAKSVRRPFLHQFLAHIYKDYDIGIWSATSMEVLEKKMNLLGVESESSYKISFYLDRLAMICVDSPKFGRVRRVKPLGVVWRHFPQFSAQNTIMIDDSEKSFIMNPQSGLKIKKFVQAKDGAGDQTLLFLSGYLKTIANIRDFSILDHNSWQAAARPISVEIPVENNNNNMDFKEAGMAEEEEDPSALSDME